VAVFLTMGERFRPVVLGVLVLAVVAVLGLQQMQKKQQGRHG
jgi:hypothetical protein